MNPMLLAFRICAILVQNIQQSILDENDYIYGQVMKSTLLILALTTGLPTAQLVLLDQERVSAIQSLGGDELLLICDYIASDTVEIVRLDSIA